MKLQAAMHFSTWDLSAVQAGKATLQIRVNYKRELCAPTHGFYGFANAHSYLVRISVRETLP